MLVSEGWEERGRLEGQTLWSQKLIKGLGSSFMVSPRAGRNKMGLSPLTRSGIHTRWVYFSTLKWTEQNEVYVGRISVWIRLL